MRLSSHLGTPNANFVRLRTSASVCAGHGRVSGLYLGHTPSGTRMEWEDFSPQPIANGSTVLSNKEMKYGKDVRSYYFRGKYRAYSESDLYKLRVDNRALA